MFKKNDIVEKLGLPVLEDGYFWTVRTYLGDVYQFWWVIALNKRTFGGLWSEVVDDESFRVEYPNDLPAKDLRAGAVRLMHTNL